MLSCILFLLLPVTPLQETTSSWRDKYDVVLPSGKLYIVKKYYNDTINVMRIDRKWKAGIVDANGGIVLPVAYDDVSVFSEGLAEVVKGSTCSSDWDRNQTSFFYEGLHGYVNEKGIITIPLQYAAAGEFHEGLAWVTIKKPDGDVDWLYIDKAGTRPFNYTFYEASRFAGGTARVIYRRDGKEYTNYIDHSGKLLIPYTYHFLEPFQSGLLRAFSRKKVYGFLDEKRREVIPPLYSFVDLEKKMRWQGLRLIGRSGRYGYINEKNGVVAIPPIYDSLFAGSKHLLWAKKGAFWGAINNANQVVIPFRYSYAEPFYEQLACVSQQGKYGFVDTTGHLRADVIYDKAYYFHEGRAVVRQGDTYGFLNSAGEAVILPVYSYVSFFTNGKAKAHWYFLHVTLDKQGNWLSWTLSYPARWVLTGLVLAVALVSLRSVRRKMALHVV